MRIASSSRVRIAGLLLLAGAACSNRTTSAEEGGTGTSDGGTTVETGAVASGTAAISTGLDGSTTGVDPSTTDASTTAAGSTTGMVAEPMEYVGFWSTGFGFSYFTPCGEPEAWFAEGLPAYELCNGADELYLRVIGVELPPFDGSTTPRIEVLEILEGPCYGGSCDGSVEVGLCGTFDELCFPPG